jgi:hypothetical protein
MFLGRFVVVSDVPGAKAEFALHRERADPALSSAVAVWARQSICHGQVICPLPLHREQVRSFCSLLPFLLTNCFPVPLHIGHVTGFLCFPTWLPFSHLEVTDRAAWNLHPPSYRRRSGGCWEPSRG